MQVLGFEPLVERPAPRGGRGWQQQRLIVQGLREAAAQLPGQGAGGEERRARLAEEVTEDLHPDVGRRGHVGDDDIEFMRGEFGEQRLGAILAALEADVLLAFPVHEAAFRAALGLAARHPAATVSFLADSPEHARLLDTWSKGQPTRTRVLVDVDTGMARTGTFGARWQAAAPALVGGLGGLEFVGVHGYDGHLGWGDPAADTGHDALVATARAFTDAGAPVGEILTSGSYSYPQALAHPGLGGGPWRHRVAPGTIVLGDRRIHRAAADLGLHQAAFVAARIVSRDGATRVTLDAGTKAIAPDRPAPTCEILGWPELFPLTPSEEHLPVRVGGLACPPLGLLLWLVPDHVCTTVNLHRAALLIRGAEVVGESPIAGGHGPWLPL